MKFVSIANPRSAKPAPSFAGGSFAPACVASMNHFSSWNPRQSRGLTSRKRCRRAFTLFELILAIALSVALLALIGTAINLYLLQVDASRTRIEETQLARSVLAMIASDLRATSIYKPQDTSGAASLVSASSQFDVDSLDNPNAPSSPGSTSGGAGSPSGPSSPGSPSTSGSGASGIGMSGGSGLGGSAGGGAAGTGGENDLTMPLGVNGTVEEIYVDVERLPRLDELFLSTTGYSNTQTAVTPVGAGTVTPAQANSVKTVRYFVRQGKAIEAGSLAATSLAPEAQMEAGGLVRQQIPRPQRVMAEQIGDQSVLDSGQTLIAPEVVHIEFRYFDPTLGQVIDYWDMKEKGGLPPAIEVRIWIMPPGSDESVGNPYDLVNIMATAHEYRQIVHVPNSALCAPSAATGGATGGTGTTGSGSSATGSGSSMSGTGSSFDN